MKRKVIVMAVSLLMIMLVTAIPALAQETQSKSDLVPALEKGKISGEPLSAKQFSQMMMSQSRSAEGMDNQTEIGIYQNPIVDVNSYNWTDIVIDNVDDLYGVSIDIYYDPSVIQINEDDINYVNDWQFQPLVVHVDNANGVVNVVFSRIGSDFGFNGSTDLMGFEYQAISPGTFKWNVTSDKNITAPFTICIQLANSALYDPTGGFGNNQIPYEYWSEQTHILDVAATALAGFAYDDYIGYDKPVDGAIVSLYPAGNTSGNPLATTTTGADGYFEIPRNSIPVGEYSVVFEKAGYEPAVYGVYVNDDWVNRIWAYMWENVNYDARYDFDSSNVIDLYDIVYVSKHVGSTDVTSISKFDFNGDGLVNYDDVVDIARRYNLRSNI